MFDKNKCKRDKHGFSELFDTGAIHPWSQEIFYNFIFLFDKNQLSWINLVISLVYGEATLEMLNFSFSDVSSQSI